MFIAGILIGLGAFGLKFGVAEISLTPTFLLDVLSNPLIWVVGIISLVGFLLMQKSLHGEKVAIVAPMIGGISIILPGVLAWLFLGDVISTIKWAGIVLILIVWPSIQFVLASRFDVNPTWLFGYAMAITPHTMRVELIDTTGGKHQSFRSIPRRLQPAISRFLRMRTALGKLYSVDSLANMIRAVRPQTTNLTIVVEVCRLNPKTAKIQCRYEDYEYEGL